MNSTKTLAWFLGYFVGDGNLNEVRHLPDLRATMNLREGLCERDRHRPSACAPPSNWDVSGWTRSLARGRPFARTTGALLESVGIDLDAKAQEQEHSGARFCARRSP